MGHFWTKRSEEKALRYKAYDLHRCTTSVECVREDTGNSPEDCQTTSQVTSSEKCVNDGARTEFLSHLRQSYEKRYNAIQPMPYNRDTIFCVDKVFVEGGIEYFTVNKWTRDCENWGRLNSYQDIFNDVNMKSYRRILEGDPGFGKTTLTLQLAYDWCNRVPGSVSDKYEILILLEMKRLGGVKSIFEAVKRFMVPKASCLSQEDVEQILRESQSVLIILDGFDEYPEQEDDETSHIWKIIKMDMFQMFDVVLTTRTGCVPKDYATQTKRIRLTGFDDRSRNAYIQKAVVGNDENIAKRIKGTLLGNPVLSDLFQAPLLFVMFAHLIHESEHLRQFQSVTDFFSYMIKCFHYHLKNKTKDANVQKFDTFEENHEKLDKVAFESICKEKQRQRWGKEEMRKRLGRDFYNHYVRLGLLIEDDVFGMESTNNSMVESNWTKRETEVRFYHEQFIQWYAAHHLASYVGSRNVRLMGSFSKSQKRYHSILGRKDICDVAKNPDPFEFPYLFKFVCGLHPEAAGKIIEHLKNTNNAHFFVLLCILEKEGKVQSILDCVRDLCSEMVRIMDEDSLLLQQSTLEIFQVAESNQIPIPDIRLYNCFSTVDLRGGNHLQFKSNFSFPVFNTLNKLTIHEEGKAVSQEEFKNILEYSSKCRVLKELWFWLCLLPSSVQAESVVPIRPRNVKVIWNNNYRLNLESSIWEHHKHPGRIMTDEDYEAEAFYCR